MKTGIRLLAVTALLSAACSSAPAPSASATTPSSAPTTTSSPLQPGQCQASSNPCLALVTLRGSNQIVVRDVTDISHPKTIGTLGAFPAPQGGGPAMEGSAGQFISANEVAYAGGTADTYFALPTSLFRVPLSGSPRVAVVNGSQAVLLFGWHPNASTVAYLTQANGGSFLHELTAGKDRIVTTMPPVGLGGGCEVAPCTGPFQNPGDSWDFRLAYSPDGNSIAVAQNGITSFLWILSADGRVLSSSNPATASMSVWSGGGLYFRDSKGVEVWRHGAISPFLPGVGWIRPKASPDSTHIVYEARDAKGSAHVYIVDSASRQARDLGKSRMEPAFLTSRYIWYEAEPACVAAQGCQAGFPGIASGQTYIYDLQDGVESASAITSVLDVWPHAA